MIYQTIRDRICYFDYPPATLLKESELAEEFGVSRTPIRQILQRLEAERLVEVRDGVGTIVTGVDFRRLKEVYELRLRISEVVTDFIDRPSIPEAIEHTSALLARAQALGETRDLRRFWGVENERHRMLNALISNEPLRELHDNLYMQTARVWFDIVDLVWQEALESLSAELAELHRALVLGDAKAIAATSRNYIAYSMTRLSKHLGLN